jgi:hypothetical protein
MTTHARQQIREATATALTGLTTTGSRVFQSRMVPQESLPCLLVTTNSEEINPQTIGNRQERMLELVVHGYAKQTATVDDVLDQIALEVETAMAVRQWAVLQRIDVDFDEHLEKPVGSISLTYQYQYFTNADAPGVPL